MAHTCRSPVWDANILSTLSTHHGQTLVCQRDGHVTDTPASDWTLAGWLPWLLVLPLCGVFLLLFVIYTRRSSSTTAQKDLPDSPIENESPEVNASLWSKVTFGWFTSMVLKGYRSPLQKEDLWPLPPQHRCAAILPEFERNWEVAVASGFTRIKNLENTLTKTFGRQWLHACLFKLGQDLLMFISPMLLRELISFAEAPSGAAWWGYTLAVLLYLNSTAQTLCQQHFSHRIAIVAMHVRATLISAIYKKVLRMNSSCRDSFSVGKVVNMISVDTKRLEDFIHFLPVVWAAPFHFGLSLYFLWRLLGPSVLAGLAVMVTLIPMNSVFARRSRALLEKEQKYKDDRIKMTNEVLNGIKVLKLYAWEPAFQQKILDIRNKELQIQKQRLYLDAAASVFWHCVPFLVTLTTFSVYVMSSADNVMDAPKVFVAMSLFAILERPISKMPHLEASATQKNIFMARLGQFLRWPGLDESCVEEDPSGEDADDEKDTDDAVVIDNGTFCWGRRDDEPTLTEVRKGSLVAIVGTVGSGKSSLLSGILGEMEMVEGSVKTKGRVAYVPQQAWIQNATLKENILFNKAEDEQHYERVVQACALVPDINRLPAGDQTEIGEKGANLSGGQKQRASLARAVYNDASIYLLDDPRSALDVRTGIHIFDKVISKRGMLKDKTRILVTNWEAYLPEVDYVIVLKDGVVTETGTYVQLLMKRSPFTEFLNNCYDEDTADEQIQNRDSSLGNAARKESCDRGSTSKDKLIKDEVNGSGKFQRSFHKLTLYMRSAGFGVALTVVLLQVLNTGTSVATDMWLSKWRNDVQDSAEVIPDETTDRRYSWLAVYGCIGFVQAIVVFTSAIALAVGATRASHRLHSDLLLRCLRAPMWFYDTTPIGRVVNRFTNDMSCVDVDIPKRLKNLLTEVCSVVTTLCIIAYSTPAIVIVLLPLTLGYIMMKRVYSATSRRVARLCSASSSPIYSHLTESLQGAPSIRAYRQTQHFIQQSQRLIDAHNVCTYTNATCQKWLNTRLECMGGIIVLITALLAVVGRDYMSAGLIGLSITHALKLTQVLSIILTAVTRIEDHVVAVERIREYSEMASEAPWRRYPPRVDWPKTGTINFDGYSARYRPGLEPVLDDVTFQISSGERALIFGRTGAGKSSLTLALFRIIEPAAGSISIDGVDISDLGLHDLRSQITIIPQDPTLFSGSLRMNLDPFDVHTTEQLLGAVRAAHLETFVQGLPAGLQHQVSEGGDNLSLGQRQLVCLARALLRKTQILVLDEATASLDEEMDKLIQTTIQTHFTNSTIITISHRSNNTQAYDRSLVFANGRVGAFIPLKAGLRWCS